MGVGIPRSVKVKIHMQKGPPTVEMLRNQGAFLLGDFVLPLVRWLYNHPCHFALRGKASGLTKARQRNAASLSVGCWA